VCLWVVQTISKPAKTNGFIGKVEVGDNIIEHRTRIINTRFVDAFPQLHKLRS